jgi:hypothetical protein
MRDARCKSIAGFIAALEIFARYTDRAMEETYFLGAEYDIIYIYVDPDKCPEDSEDGNKLVSLGWHVDDVGWGYFT